MDISILQARRMKLRLKSALKGDANIYNAKKLPINEYRNGTGCVRQMRINCLMIGMCLFALALSGSASVPGDAKPIELGQKVVDFAPGAYYEVAVPAAGTLAVVLEELPAEMKTRIVILDEVGDWLVDEQTAEPGQIVRVEARADAPGAYYIGIMDLEGKSHETPYAFYVELE